MQVYRIIFMYAVVLAFLSTGSSYSEQSDADSRISVEQKEKAHEILKQALHVAKKEPLILPSIAVVLARIDVDEALDVEAYYEPIMGSIALGVILFEAAKEDKQKGLALIEQAMGAAGEETSILGQVAAMAAQIDADTAVEISGNIKDPSIRGMTLRRIASVVAEKDPDRALAIAEKMEADSARAKALRVIAALVARTDPDRALMIAQNINEDYSKAGALCDIAEVILGVVERPASVEYAMSNLMIATEMYFSATRSR